MPVKQCCCATTFIKVVRHCWSPTVVSAIGVLVEAQRYALRHTVFPVPPAQVVAADVDTHAVGTGAPSNIHFECHFILEATSLAGLDGANMVEGLTILVVVRGRQPQHVAIHRRTAAEVESTGRQLDGEHR